jgi:hypothetical protein
MKNHFLTFLTTAQNSLSQRLVVELTERGHKITWSIESPQAKAQ